MLSNSGSSYHFEKIKSDTMNIISFFLIFFLITLIQGESFFVDPDGGGVRTTHCAGRLEIINLSGAQEMEFFAVGFKKRNIRVKRRPKGHPTLIARSHGNCCWSLYPK